MESGSGSGGREEGGLGLELSLAYALVAVTFLVVGLVLGLNGRPELSSYMVVGGILAYLITTIVYYRARWIPLMLTLGLHIGAVVTYYSNPIALPLVIVERWGERAVVNIDIVQLIVAYEIAASSFSFLKQNLKAQRVGDREIGPR